MINEKIDSFLLFIPNTAMCQGCESNPGITTTILICCNKLKEIPDILVNLTHLYILDNKIIEYIPETLINLEFLSVNKNRLIKSIPKTLIQLKMAIIPYLSIEEIPNTLTKLQLLICESKLLRTIPPELTDLKGLHIMQTKVRHLPITLTKLKILNCCYTLINSIPSEFDKLEEIICEKTLIKEIPDTIKKSLNTLSCIHSQIKEIDLSTFKNRIALLTCTCVKIKLDDRMPNIKKRYDCKKNIKQIRFIQRVYRCYRFKRNLAIWIKLHLPFELYKLVKSY